MRVLVCIKRVPNAAGKIVQPPTSARWRRAPGSRSARTSGDRGAVRLVEANGGESVVLTLGPADPVEQLRDAMAVGVSRAIHLETDGQEWDAQATAGAIVDAIRADEDASGPFDLVLFGNESADAGGYQVGIRAYARRPVRGSRASPSRRDRAPSRRAGRDVYELPSRRSSPSSRANVPRHRRFRPEPASAGRLSRLRGPASRLEMVRPRRPRGQ
jgi:electron transfer flavoprotein beta subunit